MENFHIQPIVDLASGRVCGGEVLWRPGGNAPASEQLQSLVDDPAVNLKVTQDSFIFVFSQLERIQSNVWLSVNLSCRFIGSGRMFFRPISRSLPDLDNLRRKVGKRLVVEVTERGVAGHEESAFINELTGLHTIAVDDFGTGDAPLSHMLNLKFSKVKVDRSIITGIDSDSYRQRFLQWLLAGCHAIGVEVCAEGVETESEASFLRRIGVDQGQGWLWSKALPADQFEALTVPMESVTQSLGRILNAS